MIVLHKKMLPFAGACLLFFLAILSGLCTFVDRESIWFSNLFFDKMVVLLLTPPLIWGMLIIERSMTPVLITRTQNRKHALLLQLTQQCFLEFVYLTIWITLLVVFSFFKFGSVCSSTDAFYILSWYCRFLLGYMILIIGAALLKKSNIWLLKSSSYVLVYLFFVLEVLAVIPELDQQLGIEINLVFSWMFNDSIMSVVSMLIILAVLTGLLIMAVQREDIY